jgi:hypothetical protein
MRRTKTNWPEMRNASSEMKSCAHRENRRTSGPDRDPRPRRFVFVLFVIAVACLSSCRNQEPGQRESMPEKKFTIAFPEGWEVKENVEGMDLVGLSPVEGPSDKFQENVFVASTEMKEPHEADEILDDSLSVMINTITDFKPEKRDHAEVGGIEAARLTFTWRQGPYHLTSVVYVLPGRDRAYQIRATAESQAWDRVLPVFEKIVSSFEVKP